jgi:hypothetical protein
MSSVSVRARVRNLARRGLPLAAAFPLLAALTAAPAAAAPAAAAPTSVLTQGSCSIHSAWKITMAYTDNNQIEAAFEVDQNKIGVAWKVTLKHNGVQYFSGTRKTLAPDGSFEVNRLVPNLAGVDTIRGVAINPATGESCAGSASL